MSSGAPNYHPVPPFLLNGDAGETIRDDTIERLRHDAQYPFSAGLVLDHLLMSAEQVYPHLENYDTIVTEGDSARNRAAT